MKVEIIDARGGDYVTAQGKVLRMLIKERIHGLETSYKQLVERMNNEIPDKADAVTLMIALADNVALNERALFFKACVERAAYFDREIRELNTLGQTFREDAVYMLTVQDAIRYGL
jgi:predicted ester cyclase